MFFFKHRLNFFSKNDIVLNWKTLHREKHRIVKNIASLKKVNIAHPYL